MHAGDGASLRLFESMFGRTPGKLISRTRVIHADGPWKASWWRVLRRTLIRLLPFEVLSLKSGMMWHDRWSGTRVVNWPPIPNPDSTGTVKEAGVHDRPLSKPAGIKPPMHPDEALLPRYLWFTWLMVGVLFTFVGLIGVLTGYAVSKASDVESGFGSMVLGIVLVGTAGRYIKRHPQLRRAKESKSSALLGMPSERGSAPTLTASGSVLVDAEVEAAVGGPARRRHDLASEAAVTYSLQYLLDEGRHPSESTVSTWIKKLEALDEGQILGLHSDIEALKRFLRSP